MTKKLIVATVSFDMVVAVDADSTDGDNDEFVRGFISDAVSDMSELEFEIELSKYNGTNAVGWDGMCVPYGGGNTRIKDYL